MAGVDDQDQTMDAEAPGNEDAGVHACAAEEIETTAIQAAKDAKIAKKREEEAILKEKAKFIRKLQ